MCGNNCAPDVQPCLAALLTYAFKKLCGLFRFCEIRRDEIYVQMPLLPFDFVILEIYTK